MKLSEFIQILQITIWPVVALIGLVVLKSYIPNLLSRSKITLSLFGQSIETNLSELERVIEEQAGGSLTVEELKYLHELDEHGSKAYADGTTSGDRKIVRPLRDSGLVRTVPRSASLQSTRSIELTSLGHLYIKAKTPPR